MSTTNSTTDGLQFISVSQRAYKYVRQFSIKDPVDAIVELMTNADDAYARSNPRLAYPYRYFIVYHEKTGTLQVIDNATGLTADQMRTCFLQVGNYTATDGSRGFFSRGAKDVSILGDVYFETIKDGKYSKCMINSDAEGGMLVSNQSISMSDPLRTKLKIPYNGLAVTINLLQPHRPTNIAQFEYNITYRAHLREIFSEAENSVYFMYYDIFDNLSINERISYLYPPVDMLLLDSTYEVPTYPGVQAQFVMFKATGPLPQPMIENQMQFGFLIKSSDTTVHEVSTLDDTKYRWNPYINLVYGYLLCPYIVELMKDYDQNGSSPANPFAILDPSRSVGLVREHPFTQSLLKIPIQYVSLQLSKLDGMISKSSVNVSDFNDILTQMEQLGLNMLDSIPAQKYNWQEDPNSNLIKAIQNDRENYVITERNYTLETSDVILDPNSQIMDNINEVLNGVNVFVINQNEIIPLPGLNVDPFTTPLSGDDLSNLQQSIQNNVPDNNFTNHPYIYKLNSEGELQKLFIFNNGQLVTLNSDEQATVTDKKKRLNIRFTSDPNMIARYSTEIANGQVNIAINVNDAVVSKYLKVTKTSTGGMRIANDDEEYVVGDLDLASGTVKHALNKMRANTSSRVVTPNGTVYTSGDQSLRNPSVGTPSVNSILSAMSIMTEDALRKEIVSTTVTNSTDQYTGDSITTTVTIDSDGVKTTTIYDNDIGATTTMTSTTVNGITTTVTQYPTGLTTTSTSTTDPITGVVTTSTTDPVTGANIEIKIGTDSSTGIYTKVTTISDANGAVTKVTITRSPTTGDITTVTTTTVPNLPTVMPDPLTEYPEDIDPAYPKPEVVTDPRLTDPNTVDPEDVTIQMSSLKDVNNNKSYVFLAELFIDIFSRIVLSGKVLGKGLVIDGETTLTTVNKVYNQKDQIVNTIQVAVSAVFENYYKANSLRLINDITTQLSAVVSNQAALDALSAKIKANFSNLF